MKRNAVAWVALAVSTAAMVGSRGLTRPVPAAQEIPAEGQKTAKALSEAFGAVADFVKPSVVQISIERKAGPALRLTPGRRAPGQSQPFPMPPKELEDLLKKHYEEPDFQREQFVEHGTGSGFVYDGKGHILTNNHVVADAKKIVVTFHDGEKAVAKVVGADPETDVAVIQVDQAGYRPAKIGQSRKLRVGEWVLAFGSPFGLSQTVTSGIVSATGRDNVDINEYESFIQTDAAINPGNSGGPLVDLDGRVVGINSAIATASRSNAGVGFAIPIDLASRLADRLIRDGKVTHARLGTVLQALSPALSRQLGLDPKTKGVLVNGVVPDSPADKAGLKEGDVITRFDDTPVTSHESLRVQVATSDVGKAFNLNFIREGHEKTARVVLASADEVDKGFQGRSRRVPRPRQDEGPGATDVAGLGFSVEPVTPELAEKYGHPTDAKGLIVAAVKDEGAAQDAGLAVGDLITRVLADTKYHDVKGVKDLEGLVAKRDEFSLFVRKPGAPVGSWQPLARPKSK
ncbi:MAG TPA: trypsin-like peptidase domain-containing protein [Isosphaeraceae bacterium]|jgi:serine protease Do|nr:trypsin-like peptidase domain-containing protein [Isosphaeraceae bacterium]